MATTTTSEPEGRRKHWWHSGAETMFGITMRSQASTEQVSEMKDVSLKLKKNYKSHHLAKPGNQRLKALVKRGVLNPAPGGAQLLHVTFAGMPN